MCTGLMPLNGDPLLAQGGITSWVIGELYHTYLPIIL
jgi:hypothetical protein